MRTYYCIFDLIMKYLICFMVAVCSMALSLEVQCQTKEWIVTVPGDPGSAANNAGFSVTFQTSNYIGGIAPTIIFANYKYDLHFYDGQQWKKLVVDSIKNVISIDEHNDTFVAVLSRKQTGDVILMHDGTTWKPLGKMDSMEGKSWVKGLGFINLKFYRHKLYGLFMNDDYNMTLMEYTFQTNSLKTIATFQQNRAYSFYYHPLRMALYEHDKKLYVAGAYDSTDGKPSQGFGYYDGNKFVDKQLFQPRAEKNFNVVKQIDVSLFAVERPGLNGDNKDATLHLMRNDTIIKDITGNMFKTLRPRNNGMQIAQNNFQIFRLNGKLICYDLYSASNYNGYGLGAISYDELSNTWDTFDLMVSNGSTFFFKDRAYLLNVGLKMPPMLNSKGCFMVSPSLYVSGVTYFDNDSNCIKSAPDSTRRREWVSLKNDSFYYSYLSDPDGGYEIPLKPGKYVFTSGRPSISVSTCGKDTLSIDSIKFYKRDVAYSFVPPYNQKGDIDVKMSGAAMRRGRNYVLTIVLDNHGKPELTVQPRLKFSRKLQFLSSNTPVASQGDGSIVFKPCKSSFEKPATITVTFFTHQDSAKVDDVLTFETSADSSNSEVSLANNISTYSETVVGPSDPNSIQCNPGNKVFSSPADIRYTIHFQNLGSDTAFDVRLVDTIPQGLDITSLNLLEHSGISLKAIVSGNIVEFKFKDIKLCPKAVDEEGSRGYVIFSLKLEDTMKINEVIRNRAGIYFDFEDAVITNTCELKRIKPNPVTKLSIKTCAGKPYYFSGNSIIVSGTYFDTMKAYDGLDSTIELSITFGNLSYTTIREEVCEGLPVMFNDLTISAPGIYTDTLINSVGCDSVITLTVVHLQHSSSITNATVCEGQYFTFNNRNYTLKGIFTDTLSNHRGCDSICTLELNIDSLDADIHKNGRKLSSTVPNAHYKWFKCDSGYTLIIGEDKQNFSADNIGFYTVVVTKGSCSDTSACVPVNANDLSVDDGSIYDLINIFPNPGNGQFIIDVRLPGTLLIYDQFGKLLLNKMLSDHETINLENAAAGIYYFKYETELGQKLGKIIIQNSF
jgi:uncharacterized repeat protein (TIGR01451 family)